MMLRTRYEKTIHITVKQLVIGIMGVAFVVLSSIWFLWSVALSYQIHSVREDLIVAMTSSLKRAMVDNFEQCHANLLRLENCQALLSREKTVVDDLTRLLQKKDPDEVFKQEDGDAKEVKKSPKKVAGRR